MATAEGARGLATTCASAARDYLKAQHPDDTERALLATQALPDNVGAVADSAPAFRTPDCPDCACVQDGQCLCTPSKPSLAPVALRLAEHIGTGSQLWAVSATGEDWEGCANWLVRADSLDGATATVKLQYGDLPEEDRPDAWEVVFVGDFA